MVKSGFWRYLAIGLQKAPWIIRLPYAAWRLRQPKFTIGVVGAIFNPSGSILLVEHVFHPHAPWGLPGGWVDRNEDPAHAVQREICEELQLRVKIDRILLAEVTYQNHIDFAFLCEQTGPIGKLSNELLAYRWCPLQALPKLQSFHYRTIQQALAFAQRTDIKSNYDGI